MKEKAKSDLNQFIVNELRGNVRELIRDKKFIQKIVEEAVSKTGIESTTVLRREYDGCSEASWLVEKMIGEFLLDGKINR